MLFGALILYRQGDQADMAVVELVGRSGEYSANRRWFLNKPAQSRPPVVAAAPPQKPKASNPQPVDG